MPISRHTPVLLEETIRALNVQPGGRYIDCTVGGGGHAAAILEHSAPGGQLLGIDADPAAIRIAQTRLEKYQDSMLLVNENFANVQAIGIKYDFFPVHGILFDLGLASFHLNGNGRGFSFQHKAPLDMRFDPHQRITAADIVNKYPEHKLAELIHEFGEESFSRQIARRIVQERPIETTTELSNLIEQVIGRRRGKIHPATRTFQALRIAVNQELDNLESALRQAVELLGYDGRLVVIAYHSLEDRIVKRFMQREARQCICPPNTPTCICGHQATLRLVNRKVITPSPDEVQRNPRSRSARLRAAERVIFPGDCYVTAEEPSLVVGANASGWRRPAVLEKLRLVFSMS